MKIRLLGIMAAAVMLTSALTPVYADNIDLSGLLDDTVTLGLSADEDELLEDDTEKDDNWYAWRNSTTLVLKGQLPNTDNEDSLADMIGTDKSNIKKIIIYEGTKANKYAKYMFEGLTNLTAIEGLSNLDTSAVENMRSMFMNCISLKSLDLSGFDTSNVKDTSQMFYNCTGFETLDLSGLDTSNVKYMDSMFNDCDNLRTVNLTGKFNTANAVQINYMFADCENLESLDLSNFDTGNAKYMSDMFMGCESLRQIKFSDNFVTDKVESIQHMFNGCKALESLDLSGFLLNGCDTRWMFESCYSLTSLKLPRGFSVNEDMCLPNTRGGYLGWSRNRSSVISGSDSCAVFTADATATYIRITESPKITKINYGNGRVELEWSAIAGNSGYNIKYASNTDMLRGISHTLACRGTSYTLSLPENGYKIWVVAIVNGKTTTQMNAMPIYIRDFGINVDITENGSPTNVTLSWDGFIQPNNTRTEKYKIICLDANGNIKATRETKNTSFNWNGLTVGTKYGFYVQPYVNGAYPLFDANHANDKPYIKYYTPQTASPKINKISTGNKKAWVYWDKMANATSYRVYVIQNGEERCAGTTTGTKLLVTDMTNGVRAYYYVKAVVNGKLTTQKNKAYSTPRDGVKPTITMNSCTASIKWTKYTGATKYKVVQVDANRKKLDERTTTGTAFDWKKLTKGKKYGFYIQPYVDGEFIPFGLSYPEDQANIVYITAK